MRVRVEKGDFLGWTKSIDIWCNWSLVSDNFLPQVENTINKATLSSYRDNLEVCVFLV